MTKEEQAHALYQGFLCRQGDCLRNAFLITMGWDYAGYLPQRERGYSLGMLAHRVGHAYIEFEYISVVQGSNPSAIARAFSGFNEATFAEYPTGANVIFCTGLNKAKQPHGWALVKDKNTAGAYLVDAANAGVELVQGERLVKLFARTRQLAIVAHNGEFTANSGAKFIKNLPNLPLIHSSDTAGK